jgi:hypothetical protein
MILNVIIRQRGLLLPPYEGILMMLKLQNRKLFDLAILNANTFGPIYRDIYKEMLLTENAKLSYCPYSI